MKTLSMLSVKCKHFMMKTIQFYDFGGGVTKLIFVACIMLLYDQITLQIKVNVSGQFCDHL